MEVKEILDFLRELRTNNNREWFSEHKDRYDQLRIYFSEKVNELIQFIASFDPDVAGLDAKDCVYRIYRDIRFSPDKTPYKTYFSAYMAKGGRKSLYAGYYLHIEPDNCILSGGIWCPESKLLKALRQAVFDHGDELSAIIANPPFKKIYGTFDGEVLKTVPRPFPKDSEYAELLKRKDFVVLGHKDPSFFSSPDWIKRCAEDFKILQPFNIFLNYTVDDLYE